MPLLDFDPENHLYSVDGEVIPSTTQILKAEGLLAFPAGSERAMLKGSYVHLACEYLDWGTLDEETLDATLAPYVEAYKLFLAESRFEADPEHIERRLYHPGWKYAGTMDRTGMMGKAPAVLDIKTGSPHPAYALQLAAYKELLGVNNVTVVKGFSLYLHDTGKYTLTEVKDMRGAWQTFAAALTLYKWKQANNINGGKS
jgi:hypothetical protein